MSSGDPDVRHFFPALAVRTLAAPQRLALMPSNREREREYLYPSNSLPRPYTGGEKKETLKHNHTILKDANITSCCSKMFTRVCLFKNLSSVAWFKAMISSITVTDMIPSLHYERITAWKLIHGLSALFGSGHWLFESVDCGGKGYLKLLQAGAQKSKKTSVFFLEMGRKGGRILAFRERGNVVFLCKWFGL